MIFHRLFADSLARRFAVAAATLTTVALLLISISSWWLVKQQHASAAHALQKKETEFHATTVSNMLELVAQRLTEIANSSILATGLVDSAGRETYLTPFLSSIRQVGGIPVQILFTDFEGQEISNNGNAHFSSEQLDWLKTQLTRGARTSAIFDGPAGSELVAVEPLAYNRTRTPEGALLYKIALKDVQPVAGSLLVWNVPGAASRPVPRDAIATPIQTPEIFESLGLRLIENVRTGTAQDVAPQFATIMVIAIALAGGVFLLGSRLALTLTRDLRELEAFSREVIGHGIGVQRAAISGGTEVAGLAHSINHMLDRLYEQHTLLQQEAEKLKQLANTIPQLAWMANADGQIHWYNDRWYTYTGTTPEQMEKSGWESLHDPEYLPRVEAAWKHSVATGMPFEATFPMLSADGKFHTFYTLALPLRDASGKIVQWFGTNTDVTPLEQAEQALRESQERLKEGMIAASMAVWDQDLATGQYTFSENASTLFGVTWDGVAPPGDLIHPDDLQKLDSAREEAIAQHGQFQQVVRLVRPETQELLWIEVRGNVQCDAAGNPVSVRGVCLDISERKRAEEELREADRRKDEFLAMLAHELRNPLAPISAAAQLLKLTQLDEERRLRTSEIITRQVEHMTSLVDDLLDVSRVTRGLVKIECMPLDVGQIISDAIEQVRPLIEARQHRLDVELPPQPTPVEGDHKRLVQVLANLINNAAKYTPEGGHIVVRVHAEKSRLVLEVSDNGIGIAPEVLPRVFDLFTQAERSADRSQGGLGLGLALVKSLVELHGGKVTAHSGGVGRGATFAVRLPTRERISAATPVVHQDDGMPQRQPAGSLAVMVVDDNQDAAHTLAMYLEAAGHRVRVEHASRSALERARTDMPDVFLLDIGLPDMDGKELARRLRTLPEATRAVLIAITGYGQQYDRESTLAAGYDHYLVKPADIKKLMGMLGEVSATLDRERNDSMPGVGLTAS